MKMGRYATFAAGMLVAGVANSQWLQNDIKDEMRGTVTTTHSLMSNTVEAGNISLIATVFVKDDAADGVIFKLSGDKIDCPAKSCSLEMRADNGAILKVSSIITDSQDGFIPQDSTAFAGTLAQAQTLIVELPLKSAGNTQFKFGLEGGNFKRSFSPDLVLAGVGLGSKPSKIPVEFSREEKNGAMDCKIAVGVTDVIPGMKLSEASFCFFEGYLYTAMLRVENKKEYEKVSAYISKHYGKADSSSTFTSWPSPSGKSLDRNTSDVTFLPDKGSKGAGSFLIVDDVIFPLVPVTKK